MREHFSLHSSLVYMKHLALKGPTSMFCCEYDPRSIKRKLKKKIHGRNSLTVSVTLNFYNPLKMLFCVGCCEIPDEGFLNWEWVFLGMDVLPIDDGYRVSGFRL